MTTKRRKQQMFDHEMIRNANVRFKYYQFTDCYPKLNLFNIRLVHIWTQAAGSWPPSAWRNKQEFRGNYLYLLSVPLFVCVYLLSLFCYLLPSSLRRRHNVSLFCLPACLQDGWMKFFFLIRNCLAWERQREKYKSETWQSTLYTATIKENTRSNLRKYSSS